jgi:hypothetical protein
MRNGRLQHHREGERLQNKIHYKPSDSHLLIIVAIPAHLPEITSKKSVVCNLPHETLEGKAADFKGKRLDRFVFSFLLIHLLTKSLAK